MNTTHITINQKFVSLNTLLTPKNKLTIIPPINKNNKIHIQLTHERIETDTTNQIITTEKTNTLTTFTNIIHPTNKTKKTITNLKYKTYEKITITKLQQYLNKTIQQWTLIDYTIVHHLKSLTINNVTISITMSSTHHDNTFQTYRTIINQIKEIIPI